MKTHFLTALCLMIIGISNAQQYNLLIGTYTTPCKSDGIYSYAFNSETADFEPLGHTDKIVNPSYLTLSSDKKFVYSVNESGDKSQVSSFSFDNKKGKMRLLNQQDAMGADPCHIINDDKNVLVANYSGGSISIFGKNADGSLSKPKQVVKHEGHSMRQQQKSPHVHMLNFSPDKKLVFANDLGTDRIYVYNYNADSADEVLSFKDSIPIKTGSGPRHLVFSSNGKFVYLLQELDGTLTVFNYNNGKFKRIQESTIVSETYKSQPSAADIHLSPDGKFLYATNRGDANTISTFAIDANGKLTLKETISTNGKGPRNFAIDPSGNYLLVAHQYTNDVVIFKRDLATGVLTDTKKRIELCSPVCLVFSAK